MSVIVTTNKYTVKWPHVISHWPKETIVYVDRVIDIVAPGYGIVETDSSMEDQDAKPVLLELSPRFTEYGENIHRSAYDPWQKDLMWNSVYLIPFYRANPKKKLYDVVHLETGYVLTRCFKRAVKEFLKAITDFEYKGNGLFTHGTFSIQSKRNYEVKEMSHDSATNGSTEL